MEHTRAFRPDLPGVVVAFALEPVALAAVDVEVLGGAVLPLHAAKEERGAPEARPEVEREVAAERDNLQP